MEVAMIVKYPDRMKQDEHGTWWYYWPVSQKEYAKGTRTGVPGKCHVFNCARCGEQVIAHPGTRTNGKQAPQKYCSRACDVANRKDNPAWQQYVDRLRETKGSNWKGGRYQNHRGYWQVYKPEHPDCQGSTRVYVPEHRLVM
jgi:hypothetical protein